MKQWIFVFCLLGITAGSLAAPLNKSWLPADTKWVLHLDFDALRKSQLGSMILTELDTKYSSKIKALQELLGSNLLTDISHFTLYGPDSQEQNAVLFAQGRFNPQKLTALLALNPQFQKTAYGPYTLYGWFAEQHGKNQVGTFARDNLIAISQNQESLKRALDVLDGKLPSLSDAPWLLEKTSLFPEPILFAAADSVRELTANQPQAALLASAQSLAFFMGEKDSLFQITLLLQMPDPQTALHVEQAFLGMKAIVTLGQGSPSSSIPPAANPSSAFLSFLNHCQVNTSQNTVRIHFEMPPKSLFELFQQIPIPHKQPETQSEQKQPQTEP
jgi:hypothetical protein